MGRYLGLVSIVLDNNSNNNKTKNDNKLSTEGLSQKLRKKNQLHNTNRMQRDKTISNEPPNKERMKYKLSGW